MDNEKSTLYRWLYKPVDAASIAVFRIGFGLILFIDALRHLLFFPLRELFIEPQIFFRYLGFEWVPILREQVYTVYIVIAVASLGIMLGKFYRTSVATAGLGMAWTFLQDQSTYLNHIYMVILYCGIMFSIPANRLWSLDAKARPESASDRLPNWCRLLLILQIEIILIWAGLVKLNPDWLRLEPLWHWLNFRSDMSIVGWMFTEPALVAVAAYGIIALHLVGAPLLMVRRARPFVLATYAGFHLLNHFVFDIGIFPWVTFFASLICCEPDWPRRFRARLRRIEYVPPVISNRDRPALPPAWQQRATASLLAVWLVYQLGMPMRNLFYDGTVAWNEQGHHFAWRMKLRSKQGSSLFTVHDPASGREMVVNAKAFLAGKQLRKMPCKPDMVLQFAHLLRDNLGQGEGRVEVYTRTECSLNYRKPQLLIDDTVDLASVQRTLTGNHWITELRQPLRPVAWWSLADKFGWANHDKPTTLNPR